MRNNKFFAGSAWSTFLALALGVISLAAQAQTVSRTERYTYHDNTSKWVLGQVKSVTCESSTLEGCSNTVIAEVTYDPVTAQQLSYRSHGKLLQELTYHPDGSVKTVKDGNGKTTELSDWYRGVPRLVTYPDTRTEKAEVNQLGEIYSVFDENGYKTCYQYDNAGRWKQTNYPSETAPTTTCDVSAWNYTKSTFKPSTVANYGLPAGHWTQVLEVGNRRTITYFDGLWRPVLTEDYDSTSAATIAATKRFQRFAYDHEGRKTFESYPGKTDALTTGTRTYYDALGRVTEVKVDSERGVLSTKTAYLDGFKTQVTDARNFISTTEYLAFDSPSAEHPKTISHPEGVFTDIARDAYGKPKSITRRNADASTTLTRSYTYNSFNELCRTEEPETGATLTGYDGAGNVKWTASGLPLGTACETSGTSGAVAARRVDRTYDDRNRILTLGFPDGLGNQSWTYTPEGLPDTATVTNAAAIGPVLSKFQYNARRLLKQEDRTIQSTLYSVKTAFTMNAHVDSITYPSALAVSFTPNALGQPTKANTSASLATYHPSGALAGFTYGNNMVRTVELNERQLPKRLVDCKVVGTCTSTSAANAVVDLSYTYDEVGNVQGISDGIINPRQTRSMIYDGLSRLTNTSSTMFGAAGYSYDVLDNIKTLSVSGGSQPRNHAHCYNIKNQLTELRAGTCSGALVKSLSYDVQGNLANQAGQTFNFDFGNRLRQATGKETYGYDHAGRRAISCDSVTAKCAHFFYDNSGQLLYTHDARDNKRVDHIYLGKQLVHLRSRPLTTTTVTNKYQHLDALGTPIAATYANQSLAEKFEYEPYGQLVNGTLQNGPGYTGHVQDKATGLTYMQQRYYEPSLGRFLSVDPVTVNSANGALFNRYMYSDNNPMTLWDPDGACTGSRIQNKDGTCYFGGWWSTAMKVITPSSDSFQSGANQIMGGVPIDGGSPGFKAESQRLADIMENAGQATATVAAAYSTAAMVGIAGTGPGAAAIGETAGVTGASGTLVTASGGRYLGNSTGSSSSGGSPRAPMHEKMREALEVVRNRSRSHGACCEIDAVNKALNAGDSVFGAKMGPVQLNETRRILPACSTCREVLRYLGIE